MRKRLTRRRQVLYCTLFGLLATIAVAIIPSNTPYLRSWLDSPWREAGYFTSYDRRFRTIHHRGYVHEFLTVTKFFMPSIGVDPPETETFLLCEPATELRAKRLLRRHDNLRVGDAFGGGDHRFGFPFRSLECSIAGQGANDYQVSGGWFLINAHPLDPSRVGRRSDGLPDWIIIPFRVRPIGFALDVSIFAIMAWIVPMSALSARGRVRQRQGRCPTCAYDLANDYRSGCPECGWRREKSAAAP